MWWNLWTKPSKVIKKEVTTVERKVVDVDYLLSILEMELDDIMSKQVATYVYKWALALLPLIWTQVGPELFDKLMEEIQNGGIKVPDAIKTDLLEAVAKVKEMCFPTAVPPADPTVHVAS